MAFEALRPHQAQILGLVDQGRTLAQVVEILASQHGIKTTTATLSRFTAELRPVRRAAPAMAAAEQVAAPNATTMTDTPDIARLLEAVRAEVSAGRDENHSILEVMAGKVAALSADIVELEKAIVTLQDASRIAPVSHEPAAVISDGAMRGAVQSKTLRRIWISATVLTFLMWGALFGLLLK